MKLDLDLKHSIHRKSTLKTDSGTLDVWGINRGCHVVKVRCRVGESSRIADNIVVTVVGVTGDCVQLEILHQWHAHEDTEEDWFNPDIDYDMYLQD